MGSEVDLEVPYCVQTAAQKVVVLCRGGEVEFFSS